MFRSWSGDMDPSVTRFGLSEVSKPDAGISEVDIVFVHGINGHPYGTWTSENEKTFWPAQLLPPFVEEAKARVLVYGYDADTVSSTEEVAHSDTPFDRDRPPKCLRPRQGLGQDRIHNHAEQLVATLCADRGPRHATDHPIVFVAHSLGGIVVKRALIHSSGKKGEHTEHLQSIALSTYGILFLGTPHLGCETTKWASWSNDVSSITRKDVSQARLLEALKPNSETLQNIHRQFVELASDFHIFFFHATKMDNDWRYLVDESSAAPVIQDVERAGIQQDDSHMCTFDNDGTPGFHLVTEAIQRYAAEAPQTISNRWVMDSREQQLRLHGGMTSGPMWYPTSNPALQTFDTSATSDHATTDPAKPQPQPQPQRHYLVHWDRMNHFVGREAQLEKIANFFTGSSTQQPRVLVVHALGGQGKSQLVLEYCQRRRKDYQGMFWVNASSRSSALHSYTRMARALSSQPQANVDDGEQIIETIKTLLENWQESWLLVFDNYDKPDEFSDIRQFLPRGEHGHVIITSRRRDLDRIGDLMELGPLNPDEGVNLLLRGCTRQGIDENLEIATEIIRRLGGLALAIDQAGAYIAHRRIPPHRLQEFLETYEAQRKEIMSFTPSSLWEYGSMQSHVEEDHTKAINAFTTWEISLKQLLRDNPQQKDAIIRLLTLSAYFNPVRIQEILFRNYWAALQDRDDLKSRDTWWRQILKSLKQSQQNNVGKAHAPWLRAIGTKTDAGKMTSPHHETTDHWDTAQFWDLLTKIHNLSLVQNIEKDAQGASFSFHPLVRDWLQHRGQLIDHQQYLTEGFEILGSTAKFYNRHRTKSSIDERAALVSHIDACMLIDEHLSEPHKQLGNEETSYSAALVLATVCFNYGRYDLSEKLLHRITENVNAHISYFTFFSHVLIVHGKSEQVIELNHRCQQYRENTLDERHPDRLAFESYLSEALGNSSRYDEAEALQRKTLRLRREVLGELHEETIISIAALAWTLYRQQKFEDSEALAREALQLCKSTLPEDDEVTLNTMNNPALALQCQRQLNEAEKLLRKVLSKWQQLLGERHPVTVRTMHNLALILESTKKDEAEELYRYVVQTSKEVLRKGHPDTLISMKCLADLLLKDGRDEEAREIMQERAHLRQAAESTAD